MNVSRRTFLKASGGLTFAFAVPVRFRSRWRIRPLCSPMPGCAIAPDGHGITILSAGAEMGQGSMTSLPLIVAEEMDADWSKVNIEWAPADPETLRLYGPWPQGG